MSNIEFPTSDTETAESTPILLDDMIKKNPDAFNFNDIPLGETPTDSDKDAAFLTLGQAIGDYTPIAWRSGFYFKAPMLEQQLALLELSEVMPTLSGPKAVMLALLELAQKLFFVFDRQEGFRPATESEVLKNFSMQTIQKACEEYGGMSFSEEGK